MLAHALSLRQTRETLAGWMQSADDMERGEADGKLEGEWPRRPFKRGRKVNIAGAIIMSIYVMALIFYLWVRISKTLQLGPKSYVM